MELSLPAPLGGFTPSPDGQAQHSLYANSHPTPSTMPIVPSPYTDPIPAPPSAPFATASSIPPISIQHSPVLSISNSLTSGAPPSGSPIEAPGLLPVTPISPADTPSFPHVPSFISSTVSLESARGPPELSSVPEDPAEVAPVAHSPPPLVAVGPSAVPSTASLPECITPAASAVNTFRPEHTPSSFARPPSSSSTLAPSPAASPPTFAWPPPPNGISSTPSAAILPQPTFADKLCPDLASAKAPLVPDINLPDIEYSQESSCPRFHSPPRSILCADTGRSSWSGARLDASRHGVL
ncbi:proline-rich receptor-like protein kinase PERK9 [Iris pallida]|uniref:Proline-rich receptor-like protein kinase PERK9 n=1 Tax=Iris pallida TaxID=29817 RepID=A0AAX6G0K8_IRIPA|nr:proline-rich receptor-like protein kinase PERK9 [Iris pallida]